MTMDEFKEHMVSYIMGDSSRRYELTQEDKAAIEAIAKERFRPWACRYGANPKFSITKTGRFAGGKIEFRLEVRRGSITEAHVSGDFFGTAQADGLADALVGCPFRREDVEAALRSHGMEEAVYGITVEDMVQTIIG